MANRGEQPDRGFGGVRFTDHARSDVVTDGVIRLANVGRRVLPGRSLETHWSVRRYEPTKSVAPADLPVIAGLSRCTAQGQVHRVLLVGLIDLNKDLMTGNFGGDSFRLEFDRVKHGVIFRAVPDLRCKNGTCNGECYLVSGTCAHYFDVSTGGVQCAKLVGVEACLH